MTPTVAQIKCEAWHQGSYIGCPEPLLLALLAEVERLSLIEQKLAQAEAQVNSMAYLLLECRDALPAISIVSAKLHNIDLSLDKRIEKALEPWRVSDEPTPQEGAR